MKNANFLKLYFRTSSVVWTSLAPVAKCVAIASFASIICLTASELRSESRTIACRFFAASGVTSIFAVIGVQRRKIIGLRAALSAATYCMGVGFSQIGVLTLLSEYDVKAARVYIFLLIGLSILHYLLNVFEKNVGRSSRELSEFENGTINDPRKTSGDP
jgi:hypothetical protein